ncbi:MAG: VWA domain-containing protein [Acidobacteria bacterium]|nr:VWA domain-containing protein [Acidobacteriota bacterium]
MQTAVLLAFGGSAPPSALGQAPVNTAPQVSISSHSDLVLVPTVITDRSTHFVGGLSASEFVVRENGKPRKLSIFEEVTSSAEPLRRSVSPDTYTNSFDKPVPRRLVVIAIDTVNTSFLDQSWGRRQLVSFLNEHVDNRALFVLLTMNVSGVKIIHDATSDPSILVAALQKIHGARLSVDEPKLTQITPSPSPSPVTQPDPKTDTEVAEIRKVANSAPEKMSDQMRLNSLKVTLDSMEAIARIYAGVPGRKALVWVTGSFPYNPFDQPHYEHTWKVLNEANFAIYGVDLRGLVNPAAFSADIARFNEGWVPSESSLHTDTLSTLNLFAAATGGEAYYNTNDVTRSLQRATSDSGSYYLLGYYRDTKDSTPGWRDLKVSVRRVGVHVRARGGYFVMRPAAARPIDDVQTAFQAPVEFTGIPLAFRWIQAQGEVAPDGTRKRLTAFELALMPIASAAGAYNGNHVNLLFAGIARDNDGNIKARFSQSVETDLSPTEMQTVGEHGFVYKGQFALPAGEYTARIVVHDNTTGRMGSVIVPLVVH